MASNIVCPEYFRSIAFVSGHHLKMHSVFSHFISSNGATIDRSRFVC
jgi:hypothetical protein